MSRRKRLDHIRRAKALAYNAARASREGNHETARRLMESVAHWLEYLESEDCPAVRQAYEVRP